MLDMTFGGRSVSRSAINVRSQLVKTANAGLSERFSRLDRYDAHYKAKEYDHLKHDWFGYSADNLETISPQVILPGGMIQPELSGVSLSVKVKRPPAPRRMARMIVNRFNGYLFSDSRTPLVKVDGDDEADMFIQAVFKQSFFWRVMHQARVYGGAMGSALVLARLTTGGRFKYRAISPKCVQELVWQDPDDHIPSGVLIQYPYTQNVIDQKTGRFREQTFIYRRIVDCEADITFKPVESQLLENGKAEMEADESQCFFHRLGQFPGVWIQNAPNGEGIDGFADCEGAFQMMDDMDRHVSQQGFALYNNLDPTLVTARDPKIVKLSGYLSKGSGNGIEVGAGGSANYLEYGGTAIKVSQDYVNESKQRILDLCQAVSPDPEKLSGSAQSAKAIEYVYAPMLEQADILRTQYGEAINRLVSLTLHMARHALDPNNYVEKNVVVKFDLPKRVIARDIDPDNPDHAPEVEYVDFTPGQTGTPSVTWGPYFTDTPSDIQIKSNTLATLYTAGLLDMETAAREVARIYGIRDVDGFIRRLLERKQTERDAFSVQSGQLPGYGVGFEDGDAPVSDVVQAAQATPMARISDKTLSGSQVEVLMNIVNAVRAGTFPRESAKIMLVQFFSVSEETAESMLGPVVAPQKISPDLDKVSESAIG